MPEEYGTSELIREFLEEAEEHFQVLNADLLFIEARIEASDELPSERLDEVFRSVHTLKGLSAMFDLTGVRELAHRIEAVFDRMRKRTLTPDRACLDMLFSSVDVLQRGVAAFSAGDGEGPELAEAAAKVAEFLEADRPAAGAAATAPGGASIGEYARGRLARAAEEGLRGVRIRLRWGIELRLGTLRIRDVEAALGTAGEVLEVRPVVEDVPGISEVHPTQGDLTFEVLGLASWSDQEIADRLGVSMTAMDARVSREGGGPGDRRGANLRAGGRAPAKEQAAAPKVVGASDVVRVDIRRLDALVELTGELVTARTRLQELSNTLLVRNRKDETTVAMHRAVKETSTLVNNLQESVLGLRMVPIGHAFSKYPRVLRDLMRTTGKSIRLEMIGGETELDKRVIEQVEDPLLHILRNAADHGIEPPAEREALGKPREGVVRLSAWYEGGHAVVECSDDGRGLNLERIISRAVEAGELTHGEAPSPERVAELIMAPGFSTAEEVTQVSGRGVGLDVVRRKTLELGGSIEVTSEVGKGTTFTLRLPLTMAIIPALVLWAAQRRFAMPLAAIGGVLRVKRDSVEKVQGAEVLDLRGEMLPLIWLSEVLRLGGSPPDRRFFVVETTASGQRFGLCVDGLVGQQEIVVKGLEEVVGSTEGVGGATILGDGSIIPILDVEGLVRLRERAVGRLGAATSGGGA